MHDFLAQLTMLIVETRRRSSCRLIPWLRPHDSPAYLGTNRLTIGRRRPIIVPAPRPDAYAPRSPTMANGGSLGGLCGEGQRLAVALLQYICAKIGQHWRGTPADRPTFLPRRLLVSLPHHGEWWEPARAVRRGAAHGSGGRDASSASRSAGQPGSRDRSRGR